MDAVRVRDLRKDYGPVRALRGLSFSVAAGETYGLLGPNGAGKTTTLEILEGFREPDDGEATVLDLRPGSIEARARCGILLQSGAVDPALTAEEMLRMVAGWFPRPHPVEQALAEAGLEQQAATRVKRLSGGQRRRLDLAVALVGGPDLLFLDEPTTGFDPVARAQAWEALRAGVREGMTLLLTTHDLEEARQLCDRVGIVAAGRLIAEGTPTELAASHGVRIEVTLPEAPPPATGLQAREGGRFETRADDPAPILAALTAWAMERGIALDGLRVAPAGLDEVYRSLLEEAEG